jgi:RNA polymerase sigma-70 factor (ECF subfamily)
MSASERASDDELMAAVAAGDREAFAALYRRRRPDVYRFAAHMTGADALAEDVTQDVFMVVIHEARRYRPGRSGVVPWLLGIARNHARRRLARDRRVDPLPEPGGRMEPALTVTPDAIDALVREDDVAAVRSALRTLPYAYREVVVLCDLQEVTYADAAQAVGCAVGTVRSRLHRGRALLTACLRGEKRGLPRRPVPGWVV